MKPDELFADASPWAWGDDLCRLLIRYHGQIRRNLEHTEVYKAFCEVVGGIWDQLGNQASKEATALAFEELFSACDRFEVIQWMCDEGLLMARPGGALPCLGAPPPPSSEIAGAMAERASEGPAAPARLASDRPSAPDLGAGLRTVAGLYTT
jgi:hypothetical protein